MLAAPDTLRYRAGKFARRHAIALGAAAAVLIAIIGGVVAALWQPFAGLGGTIEDGWRNYLCLIARLANDPRGDGALDRHFGEVARLALRALETVLPDADESSLRIGLRFARALFEHEALSRCRNACPADRRALDDRRVVTFAAAGLRSLTPTLAGAPLSCASATG